MNILRRELQEHAAILKFFKSLPVDLRKYIRTFYHSVLPSLKCPCCQKCHYPLYCYHYCKRACYAMALRNLVIKERFYEGQEWFVDSEFSSESENPSNLG